MAPVKIPPGKLNAASGKLNADFAAKLSLNLTAGPKIPIAKNAASAENKDFQSQRKIDPENVPNSTTATQDHWIKMLKSRPRKPKSLRDQKPSKDVGLQIFIFLNSSLCRFRNGYFAFTR
ncbi:unnamed protein product [Caenorhabditis auriculariae]|uniref:Uncharacterized protein n=1 Tax=Caenorhabditis auriculariae TaxID=2777116 RepID=A0A8S1GP59_9PELO|nr:unnamed protein product [Caenorhabditis auriculariae]